MWKIFRRTQFTMVSELFIFLSFFCDKLRKTSHATGILTTVSHIHNDHNNCNEYKWKNRPIHIANTTDWYVCAVCTTANVVTIYCVLLRWRHHYRHYNHLVQSSGAHAYDILKRKYLASVCYTRPKTSEWNEHVSDEPLVRLVLIAQSCGGMSSAK